MTNHTAHITSNDKGLYPQCGELVEGDEIIDFRGDPHIFLKVTRGPEPGRSAKVEVTDLERTPGYSREFYSTVFPGLEVL